MNHTTGLAEYARCCVCASLRVYLYLDTLNASVGEEKVIRALALVLGNLASSTRSVTATATYHAS